MQVSSGVRFMGEGYGQFSVAQRVEGVAIEFRTSQLAALLLQVNSQVNKCGLILISRTGYLLQLVTCNLNCKYS